MAPIVTVENVNLILQFTMKRIDDWENVVPEGKELSKVCQSYHHLIKDVLDKPHLPISDELHDVSNLLHKTNRLIMTFIDQDKRKDRSAWSEFIWQIERMYLAYTHRAMFKTTTRELELSKKQLIRTLTFAKKISKPTAHWFRDSMVNEPCFQFWKSLCGEAMEISNWSLFSETYQRQFNESWAYDELEERIRRVVCGSSSNDDVPLSIAGYITLTNTCGFPLTYDKLPLIIDLHAKVSSETRMSVANMVNELITYYSTKKMRDLLVAIFTWYQGCNKHDHVAWQARANAWAETIKANRGKSLDALDERGKLAEQVDMARRTYSFFFQRYMVVVKIGQLSKDMFAEVDFPGKARMYEFIEHVKPLDKANFLIVMNNDEEKWETKQPKVYTFLEEFTKGGKTGSKEQKPFHIVLVDINKATLGEIECVELPLTDDLNYVALSYRWGELQEQMVDTKVGYTTTVTSFRREDFFQLCRAMTMESDLRSIPYVWVDAICVDQNNYHKRKATIHEMTNIYERANYVLAVPDLHLQYLKNTSTNNRKIISSAARFRKDIYYLLHKNIDALMSLEEKQLDYYGVPQNAELRQLLTKYTNFFTDGFTKFREHHYHYNPEEILDHIFESSQLASNAVALSSASTEPASTHTPDLSNAHSSLVDKLMSSNDILQEIERLHHCNKAACPFVSFIHHHGHGHGQGHGKFTKPHHNNHHHSNNKNKHHNHHNNSNNHQHRHQHFKKKQQYFVSSTERSGRNREWKQQVYDRSMVIQQAMRFLTDLVTDWSSRAWVISEFSIAKKKNNLKYWFVQLLPPTTKEMKHVFEEEVEGPFCFFEFNFNDPSHSAIQNTVIKKPLYSTRAIKTTTSDPVYLKFHQRMISQLEEQTFLEMMLRSKASKTEDRFYSVLPLSKKYKDKLTTQESVASWQVHTMLSVKLKLYEWMDTKDKLNLVFLSSHRKEQDLVMDLTLILPTFATTTIYWSATADFFKQDQDHAPAFNFDLNNEEDTIMLHHHQSDLRYLHLKPLEYYVHTDLHQHKERCQLDIVAISNVVVGSPWSPRKHPTPVYWVHSLAVLRKINGSSINVPCPARRQIPQTGFVMSVIIMLDSIYFKSTK
ncbi:unnamed protein product [Absidia cylindrospora]